MTGLLTHRGLMFWIAPIRSFFASATARLREGSGNVFLKDLGRLTVVQTHDEPYMPGQLFIHKLFPYRGIVLCSFLCPIEEKLLNPSNDDPVVITHKSLFYQVLIHCGDWKNMVCLKFILTLVHLMCAHSS
ncbi:unnamed protein product [Brugia timori]|uniref:Secreted protein n=1 Tax=Brugia timori TaxID=42155 RepID=A0A0R3QRR4_9BILA|nr:unnamed protein product [Brugia timori]